MRQKRAKTYKKLMVLYTMSFGFRQPYQVLVDSEMCKTAIDLKIELVKQLGHVLQGDVKPMITQCCIHELYLQGKSKQPAVDLAKGFERRKCNHKEAISGDDCILSVVGETNKHRYVIAALSHPLRVSLRSIPAVPLIHINRSVMVLEPPSDTTISAKKSAEEQALKPTAPDIALVRSSGVSQEPPRKRKKGPKGPNPLSVKKKTGKKTNVSETSERKERGKMSTKPSPSKEESAKVGAKRKRNTDSEDLRSSQQVRDQSEGVSEGHKRKRRRKSRIVDA